VQVFLTSKTMQSLDLFALRGLHTVLEINSVTLSNIEQIFLFTNEVTITCTPHLKFYPQSPESRASFCAALLLSGLQRAAAERSWDRRIILMLNLRRRILSLIASRDARFTPYVPLVDRIQARLIEYHVPPPHSRK
jgi:hypothetical protein